jgi:hypothetical protein
MNHKFDWTTVPMPENMAKFCRKDSRGLPVPFVVLEDDNGIYHFKVNDSRRTVMALMGKKCSICGQPMEKDNRWLVGGIGSAFDPNGVYIDIPIHKECGIYALQVCPYLAVRNYNSKTDLEKLVANIQLKNGEAPKLQDLTVDADRLPLFVLCRPEDIKIAVSPPDKIFIIPTRPFLEQEFWDEGKQLSVDEAVGRIKNTKWEKYSNAIQDVQIKTNNS